MFDGFVAAAGRPVEPYADPRPMAGEDRQRLVETAADFGVRLLPSADPSGATSPLPESAPAPCRLPGTRFEVLARLGTEDGDLVLLRDEIEAGFAVPMHSYPDRQCVFVMEGKLDIFRDGDGWRTVGLDEAIHVAPGCPYALRTVGARPVRLLIVSTVRTTQMLADVGAAIPHADCPPG